MKFTEKSQLVRGKLMKKNNNTLLRIISYLKAYKFFLFLAIFLTIGSSIFEIFSPKLMGNITTRIFENIKMNTRIDFDYVIKICIILAAVSYTHLTLPTICSV